MMQTNDDDIKIRDIVIVAKENTDDVTVAGEFGSQTDNNSIERIKNVIHTLLTDATKTHKEDNCIENSNELKKECKNNITRVVTNEFFFYTQKPLTQAEFQTLMQQINNMAKKTPSNVHLILASFSVLASNDEVMNVVAYVECGKTPRVNIIVKNFPPATDPVYLRENSGDDKIHYKNLSREDYVNVSEINITIDDQSCFFSFNNALLCTTSGNKKFHLCIDICADHEKLVASESILKKINEYNDDDERKELYSAMCSHVLVSNSCGASEFSTLGRIVHADPRIPYAAELGVVTNGDLALQGWTPAVMHKTNQNTLIKLDRAILSMNYESIVEKLEKKKEKLREQITKLEEKRAEKTLKKQGAKVQKSTSSEILTGFLITQNPAQTSSEDSITKSPGSVVNKPNK
jgi:hypothetical protein